MIKKLELKYKHPSSYKYHLIFLISDHSFETGKPVENGLEKYEYYHKKMDAGDDFVGVPVINLFEWDYEHLSKTFRTTDMEVYKDYIINDCSNIYGELVEEPVWKPVELKDIETHKMVNAMKEIKKINLSR